MRRVERGGRCDNAKPSPLLRPPQLQQHLASLLSAAAGEPPHPSDDASRAAALSSMPLTHGKALYQSYIIRVKEACKNLGPLVPPVTEYVKELHSMVIKLGRHSSLHAGNLHKALEVLEESETVRSQDMPSTHPDILQSDSSIEKDKSSSGSRKAPLRI